jgi:hypothetical protein
VPGHSSQLGGGVTAVTVYVLAMGIRYAWLAALG